MLEVSQEQKEIEEQAIALKWQSDTKWLRRCLKFSVPNGLPELREAQYFAEGYIPAITLGQQLTDVITASFIQDLPHSEWQRSAMENVGKFLAPTQQKMLKHWQKERKKISEKNVYFSKDTQLSPLDISRLYAILSKSKNLTTEGANDSRSQYPASLFSKRTFLSLIDILPFFEEPAIWASRAQQRFQDVLVLNLCRELLKKPEEIDVFFSQQLRRAALQEPNVQRSAFKIELLGKIRDNLGGQADKKQLDCIVGNLEAQNKRQKAEQVRRSFHMESRRFSSLKAAIRHIFLDR